MNSLPIKQRRIKVATQYWAMGYGRKLNTKNVYLIDGKYYAYHPAYADQAFTPLTGEFAGYIPLNKDTTLSESFYYAVHPHLQKSQTNSSN